MIKDHVFILHNVITNYTILTLIKLYNIGFIFHKMIE
jgi:hypothetical protein